MRHKKAHALEGREIPTPNLLIWSQTRCRCAIPPLDMGAVMRGAMVVGGRVRAEIDRAFAT